MQHRNIASGEETMCYLHLVRCEGAGNGSIKHNRTAWKSVIGFEDYLLTHSVLELDGMCPSNGIAIELCVASYPVLDMEVWLTYTRVLVIHHALSVGMAMLPASIQSSDASSMHLTMFSFSLSIVPVVLCPTKTAVWCMSHTCLLETGSSSPGSTYVPSIPSIGASSGSVVSIEPERLIGPSQGGKVAKRGVERTPPEKSNPSLRWS